jgi:hypothetical protein
LWIFAVDVVVFNERAAVASWSVVVAGLDSKRSPDVIVEVNTGARVGVCASLDVS